MAQKDGLFSDSEFTEVARGYRRASWMAKARIWLYVSLAVAVAAATVVSIIWVLVVALNQKPSEVNEAASSVHEAAPSDHGSAVSRSFEYDLRGISVGFATRSGDAMGYAQFSLTLQCSRVDCYEWLQLNRAAVRDAVYVAASGLTKEEMTTTNGIFQLKQKILAELKERFGPKAPQNALIHDWVLR